MSSEIYDLVVIGAGVSGLGFAHLAHRRGVKPLVLEAADRVGGCLHSHRFAVAEGTFWAELGGHTCYNSYGNLLGILEDLGRLEQLQAKQRLPFRLLTNEGLRSIPSQLSFPELLVSLPNLFRLNKEQLSVADYYGRIVGPGNFQKVLGPALDAVVCQPAAEVPANAMFRKKPRRKEVLRRFTAPGGTQGFSDAMAAQEALEIRTNTAVTRVEREGENYRLQTADSDEITCRSLALAVAPDVAARLLGAAMPRIAELLEPLEMADIESHAVLVRSERLDLEPLAGIIAAADDFYSVVSRDPVPDETYRAFTFHFRPGRLDGPRRLARICQVLGIDREDVIAETFRQNRLPALRLGHKERVAELDRVLDSGSLAVTGNWFLGVSIEDALTRSATECERLFGRGGDGE